MRALLPFLALAVACAGPGSGPRAGAAEPAKAAGPDMKEDEELGRIADGRVMSELRELADPARHAYVSQVLARVARHADPAPSKWTLRLLDTSLVSVRSGPGGYVYVTRGLLAFLGSEAELAAALAHEVAHVSSRDWRRQAEYLVRHGVEDGDVGKLEEPDRLALYARLREEEREADRLALGYLARAGYARQGLVKVIGLFAELERLAGGVRVPALLRTHPDTAARLSAIGAGAGSGEWKTREYLSRIDGLPFGEDPRDGYLYGDRYVVPNAGFELELPAAWRAQLVGRDLIAALPGKATIALVARSEHGNLEKTLSALGEPGSFGETEMGGVRAFVTKQSADSGLVSLRWVLDTPNAPFVVGLVVPQGGEDSPPVKGLLANLRKISDPALAKLGTLRVRLVTLPGASTLRSLHERQPSRTNLTTLALVNGVDPDRELPAGTLVKRIDQ